MPGEGERQHEGAGSRLGAREHDSALVQTVEQRLATFYLNLFLAVVDAYFHFSCSNKVVPCQQQDNDEQQCEYQEYHGTRHHGQR